MIDIRKFKNRMTDEVVTGSRFKGKQAQAYDLLMWVVDNNGRAQGQMGADKAFVLQVYEKNVGMVNVKPGDTVIKTESGFEVYPLIPFNQMFIKLAPVVTIMKKPEYFEAIQFTGGPDNETDITDWLNVMGRPSSFRHGDGDNKPSLRVELSDGSFDVPLYHWIIKDGSDLSSVSAEDFTTIYQEVKND